jgi:predicted DNA repair protein MutK
VSEWIVHAETLVSQVSVVGDVLGLLTPSVLNALFGVVAGGLAVLLMNGVTKLLPAKN